MGGGLGPGERGMGGFRTPTLRALPVVGSLNGRFLLFPRSGRALNPRPMCNESKYHKSVLTVSSSMNLDAFRKAGASAFGTSSMNLDDMCTPEALAFRT